MTEPHELKKALDALQSKKHAVSDEAIRAKSALHAPSPNLSTTHILLQELNKSTHLLMSLFTSSRVDSVTLFLSRPLTLFIMQFLIGLVRGLGVVMGMIIIAIILLFILKDVLPSSLLFIIAALIGLI